MPDKVMTRSEHELLTTELERLESEGRQEIAERIKVAREWGDLSENAEYHDAKNAQAMLETRIAKLRDRLLGATVVDETTQDGSVQFGSTVTVVDQASGRELTYTLVGSAEANPSAGKLSAESPVGRALLGRRAGDTANVATPKGDRAFAVVTVA